MPDRRCAAADTADIIAPQNSPATAADGWQAGTCSAEPCSPDTTVLFFTQAAGHPQFGFTQFIVAHTTTGPGVIETPVGTLKDVRVDLPRRAQRQPAGDPAVRAERLRKRSLLCRWRAVGDQRDHHLAGRRRRCRRVSAVVYNLVPGQGEPALFGFRVLGDPVFLKADVDWAGDYHEGFTIAVPEIAGRRSPAKTASASTAAPATAPSSPSPAPVSILRRAHRACLLDLPAGGLDSGPRPRLPQRLDPLRGALPPGVMPTGCDSVPFTPSIAVAPGTNRTDSPDGPAVEVKIPFEPSRPGSPTRTSGTPTSPCRAGMGLNPSAANGLQACTDPSFGKGTGTRSTARPHRRSAPSRSRRHRCPPARWPGTSTSARSRAATRLRRPLPDLRQRRVDSLRRRRPPDRQRQGQPVTGQLTTIFKENPAGPVHLGQASASTAAKGC